MLCRPKAVRHEKEDEDVTNITTRLGKRFLAYILSMAVIVSLVFSAVYFKFGSTVLADPADGPDAAPVWSGQAAESFAGGDGKEASPYLIENADQLYKMVREFSTVEKSLGVYFRITKDIYIHPVSGTKKGAELSTLSGRKNWLAEHDQIAHTPWADNAFCGKLDGMGHTIYGLYVENVNSAGLFPAITNGASISNLNIRDFWITGNTSASPTLRAGAFAGRILYKNWKNGDVKFSKCSAVQGTVGYKQNIKHTGGLVGDIVTAQAVFENCYAANVDASMQAYNATASKSGYRGGIFAYSEGTANAKTKLTNCYTERYGPVSPHVTNTVYTNVYYYYTNDQNRVTADGITAWKSTTSGSEIKGENAKENMAGFDFDKVWQTNENDFPSFKIRDTSYYWDGTKSKDLEDGHHGFAGGSGTATDPYLIENGSQLYRMVADYSTAGTAKEAVNSMTYFKLNADIYLNDVKDQSIADIPESERRNWYTGHEDANFGFNGELDGSGYTIYGLYSKGKNAGLIPIMAESANIHHLNIKNSWIQGTMRAGAVAGYVNGHWASSAPQISYCTLDSVTVKSNDIAGGFVGYWVQLKLSIQNCSVVRSEISTSSTATNKAGVFVGNGWGNEKLPVQNCFTDVDDKVCAQPKLFFFTNVYTVWQAESVEGIEAVTAEALTGETAAETLQGFDFTNDWAVTDADYPVIKADAGEHKYDKTASGEVWSGKPSRYYASGTGTAEDPYTIETGGQLALLVQDTLSGKTIGKHYKITADIILNDTTAEDWKDHANPWYTGGWAQSFRGHLDGGYHIISGLYLNATKGLYSGLLPSIGLDAVIEKVGIVKSDLYHKGGEIGSITGFVDHYDTATTSEHFPVIRECFADTTVKVAGKSCGGLIGGAGRPIKLENCFFTGTAPRGKGLIGYSRFSSSADVGILIKNCYAANENFAVLTDSAYDNMTYENCYCSSAQDAAGVTRLFIDRMCGTLAEQYMVGFDFEAVWAAGDDNQTPGLAGFDAAAYNNHMEPRDIEVSFFTNCDLTVAPVTGKAYSALTLPILTREGYRFDGWYTYAQLDVPFTYDYFPSFDTILYAKWTLLGVEQTFENYPNTEYDVHEDYEYYRPTISDYSAKYVHNGAKSMHRLGKSDEEQDFLLCYEEELEVGKTYNMIFWVTTDQQSADAAVSLVHLDWPDVYGENLGVQKAADIKGLTDGSWQQYSYTFVAKSKWLAIRTSGGSSLYFDDFLLYDTNAGTTVTPPSTDDMPTPPTGENPLYAVVAMMCAAASGIAVIQMKRRAGRR